MEKYFPILKLVAGGVAVALAVATPLVDDGLSASEILTIATAFLGGLGVTAVPMQYGSKSKDV